MRVEAQRVRPNRSVTSSGSDDTHHQSVFKVPATAEGTRSAILRILRLVDPEGVAPDDLYAMEIALAEVLNNIVEHAYADEDLGRIEIRVEKIDIGLSFEFWDDGTPMPAGRLPLGHAADPDRPAHEQEEGGYGMFLIRELARKLRYERIGERNRLSFRIALRSPAEG